MTSTLSALTATPMRAQRLQPGYQQLTRGRPYRHAPAAGHRRQRWWRRHRTSSLRALHMTQLLRCRRTIASSSTLVARARSLENLAAGLPRWQLLRVQQLANQAAAHSMLQARSCGAAPAQAMPTAQLRSSSSSSSIRRATPSCLRFGATTVVTQVLPCPRRRLRQSVRVHQAPAQAAGSCCPPCRCEAHSTRLAPQIRLMLGHMPCRRRRTQWLRPLRGPMCR